MTDKESSGDYVDDSELKPHENKEIRRLLEEIRTTRRIKARLKVWLLSVGMVAGTATALGTFYSMFIKPWFPR